MPGIPLPSELGRALEHPEMESWIRRFQRAAVPVNILNGVVDLTAAGAGYYRLVTQNNDPTDEVTSVVGVIEGEEVRFRATTGQRVTFIDGATLQLAGHLSFELQSIYASITLQSYGGNVMAERGRVGIS